MSHGASDYNWDVALFITHVTNKESRVSYGPSDISKQCLFSAKSFRGPKLRMTSPARTPQSLTIHNHPPNVSSLFLWFWQKKCGMRCWLSHWTYRKSLWGWLLKPWCSWSVPRASLILQLVRNGAGVGKLSVLQDIFQIAAVSWLLGNAIDGLSGCAFAGVRFFDASGRCGEGLQALWQRCLADWGCGGTPSCHPSPSDSFFWGFGHGEAMKNDLVLGYLKFEKYRNIHL